MSLQSIVCRFMLLLVFASSAFSTTDSEPDDSKPSLTIGTKVYATRCVLCHGNNGMGEGLLPMRLTGYPDTSLFNEKLAKTRQEVLNIIVLGPKFKGPSLFMPPFGKDLSWTESESVADFVMLLRKNREQAYAMLTELATENGADRKLGQQIYKTRCVLCHGQYGEGDGRMSKLLKNPPPADLTASLLPDQYLKKIIMEGGESVGRSKHMPPWGDQLSNNELQSLILYLKHIRD